MTTITPKCLLGGLLIALLAVSCKPYKDPAPIVSDKLTNPYCNEPRAVNYNWGFPGKPDNSICIFPTDVFKGNYTFYDSLLDAGTGLFLPYDTTAVQVQKVNDSVLHILNMCSNKSIIGKAFKNLRFTIDSTTEQGQLYCNASDTINGGGSKFLFTDTNFSFQYKVISGSGASIHKGTMKKQ